jgi:hypothetical protein
MKHIGNQSGRVAILAKTIARLPRIEADTERNDSVDWSDIYSHRRLAFGL